MKEKLKSALLTLLVIVSLLQSYVLAYNTPIFETAEKVASDYIQTEAAGPEESPERLMLPDRMILHFGDGRHTVFYMNTRFYTMILEGLQKREFSGFQRNTNHMFSWDEIRNEYEGIELRFAEGVPIELLQEILQLKGDILLQSDEIERIWIFTKPNIDEVHTVFFSKNGSTVYESTKADFKYKDIEWYLGFGEYMGEQSNYGTTYHLYSRNIYIPDQSIPMLSYTLDYKTLTPEQMQQHLFFDPSITRNILEKDGSEIYTDGKRGLQIRKDLNWIRYTDTLSPLKGKNVLTENIRAAVEFVNQHGGWAGTYRFGQLPNTSSEGHAIVFQQYYGMAPNGAYPIISDESFPFGHKILVLHQGVVARYEISLIDTALTPSAKNERMLPGGEQLNEMISRYSKKMLIQDLFPAYRPTLKEETIELEPVWGVKLTNGVYDYLD